MPVHPNLVFIDTNVWFSAFYGSQNAEKLLKAHVGGEIKAVISQKVLTELITNVRNKIPEVYKPLEKFLRSSPPTILSDSRKISKDVSKSVDINDQIIFQTAVDSKISIFITGNLKHFRRDSLEKSFPVKIFTPSEAIQYLSSHHIL
jgi:putative PIN family toxin of toxin-antitoxin system